MSTLRSKVQKSPSLIRVKKWSVLREYHIKIITITIGYRYIRAIIKINDQSNNGKEIICAVWSIIEIRISTSLRQKQSDKVIIMNVIIIRTGYPTHISEQRHQGKTYNISIKVESEIH